MNMHSRNPQMIGTSKVRRFSLLMAIVISLATGRLAVAQGQTLLPPTPQPTLNPQTPPTTWPNSSTPVPANVPPGWRPTVAPTAQPYIPPTGQPSLTPTAQPATGFVPQPAYGQPAIAPAPQVAPQFGLQAARQQFGQQPVGPAPAASPTLYGIWQGKSMEDGILTVILEANGRASYSFTAGAKERAAGVFRVVKANEIAFTPDGTKEPEAWEFAFDPQGRLKLEMEEDDEDDQEQILLTRVR